MLHSEFGIPSQGDPHPAWSIHPRDSLPRPGSPNINSADLLPCPCSPSTLSSYYRHGYPSASFNSRSTRSLQIREESCHDALSSPFRKRCRRTDPFLLLSNFEIVLPITGGITLTLTLTYTESSCRLYFLEFPHLRAGTERIFNYVTTSCSPNAQHALMPRALHLRAFDVFLKRIVYFLPHSDLNSNTSWEQPCWISSYREFSFPSNVAQESALIANQNP